MAVPFAAAELSSATVGVATETLATPRRRISATVPAIEGRSALALQRALFGARNPEAEDNRVYHDLIKMTVSRAVRVVAAAIVGCIGSRCINFHAESKATTKEGFARANGMLAGVIGCVGGTYIAILDPRVTQIITKVAYWCRKLRYALNVMVVCDSKARTICIDPSMPSGAHDSYVWKLPSLRRTMENGLL